jgi:predicted RNA-binding Zn-ribbon protein involved in translation (DUF1610 family)
MTTASERKMIYHERKERGLCPKCGVKKSKADKFVFCEKCREFYRNYNNNNSEMNCEKRKAKYAERLKKRLCPRCGVKLGKKYKNKICSTCLERGYLLAKKRK